MTQFFRAALVAGALAAGLAGCQRVGDKPDISGVVNALRGQEIQWNADYKARDVAKLAAHYAPDAVVMAPGQHNAATPEGIKAALAAMVADPALEMTFEAEKISVSASGDMAYTRGHFSMTATDPATKKVSTQTGSYVTVYEKQPDGSWKAVEDIASPGVAAPEPTAAAPPPPPPPPPAPAPRT
jgi:uncharacterized protein (TIGR02246 family)